MKGNPRGSGYELAKNSWYQESRYAIDSLLDSESFRGPIWDPACGEGNVPRACANRGFASFGTDLIDRGYGTGGMDFLAAKGAFDGDIVTNPPFDLIEPFIHHALSIAKGKVAVIGRLAFLEGSKRREALFTATPLTRVWVFSRRVSMPPGGKGIEAKGGSIPFAWFVWDRNRAPGKAPEIEFLP